MRYLAIILCVWMACGAPEASPEASNLFRTVWRSDSGLFRGLSPGVPLAVIRQGEPNTPRHEDLLGLTYRYALPDSQTLFIEYYAAPPGTGSGTDSLRSIVADVRLKDELTAGDLYREMRDRLRKRLGPPEGEFGDEQWFGNVAAGPVNVQLKLFSEQERIVLNVALLPQVE